MKLFKGIAAFAFAAMLSLAMVACSGNSNGPAPSGDDPIIVEQLTKTSGAIISFNGSGIQEATAEVTLAEGEAYVVMGTFETNPGGTTVVTSKDGEQVSTDSFYEDSSYTEMMLDPGTYSVQVSGVDSTGTIWVLAYPADTIDVMSMGTDEIIAKVLADVA